MQSQALACGFLPPPACTPTGRPTGRPTPLLGPSRPPGPRLLALPGTSPKSRKLQSTPRGDPPPQPRAFTAGRAGWGDAPGASHSPRWVWERPPRPPTFQARCTCSERASGPQVGPTVEVGARRGHSPPLRNGLLSLGPRGLPTLSWGPLSHGSGRSCVPRRGFQGSPPLPVPRGQPCTPAVAFICEAPPQSSGGRMFVIKALYSSGS